MSCGEERRRGWTARTDPLKVIDVVADRWAEYIKTEIPSKVTSNNQAMTPGQATTCTITVNGNRYSGTSKQGYHAEVACLHQAWQNGEDLANGAVAITQLSNPVCLICAAVLYAVGVTTVPNLARSSKEYANYSLPDWIFDDEDENGLLYKVFGEKVWRVWTNHMSATSRKKREYRQGVVTKMTQVLRAH